MSALLFDFDGTIADSLDVASEIFYEVTGHPRITDPRRIAYLRTLPLKSVGKELGIRPSQVPRLMLQGRTQMRRRMGSVKTVPGLHDALRRLRGMGHQLFVISSNSRQNVEIFLTDHHLLEDFDEIYGGIGLFNKKRALRKIMRRNKLRPEDCAYIGDEIRDMAAAQKAHVQAVAVAWGYNDAHALRLAGADAVAQRPADLLRIFGPDK